MFARVSYGTQTLHRGFTFGCLTKSFSKCRDNTRDTGDACSSPPKVVTIVSPGFEIKRKYHFSLDRKLRSHWNLTAGESGIAFKLALSTC